MRRHDTIIGFLILAILMLAGCTSEESAPRSTLNLQLSSRETAAKLITPAGTSLDIAKYAVKGSGPDGETFSITTTKQNVSVQGLLVGTWIVSVDGLNERGSKLAHGEATIQLQAESTGAIVYLNTVAGTGVIDLHVTWDASKVGDPSFTLELSEQGTGPFVAQNLDTSTLEEGYLDYRIQAIRAGSYLMIGRLYSGSVNVAGFTEAVRVVDGLTSEATVRMDPGQSAKIPTSITLVDQVGRPVTCRITGISEEMQVGGSVTARIEPEVEGDVSVTWYHDAVEACTDLSYTFIPQEGTHRIDMVARGSGKATLSSASFSYTGKVKGVPGVPVVTGFVKDGDNHVLASRKSAICFLDDETIAIAVEGKLQICRIIGGTLSPLATYADRSGYDGGKVASLAFDRERSVLFVASNDPQKMTAYRYKPERQTLTRYRQADDKLWRTQEEAHQSAYLVPAFGRVDIDPVGGIAYAAVLDKEGFAMTGYWADAATDDTFRLKYPIRWPRTYGKETQEVKPTCDGIDISADGAYVTWWDSSCNEIAVSPRNPDAKGNDALGQRFSSCELLAFTPDRITDVKLLDRTHLAAVTEGAVHVVQGRFSSVDRKLYMEADKVAEGNLRTSDDVTIPYRDGVQLWSDSRRSMVDLLCAGSHNVIAFALDTSGRLIPKGEARLAEGFAPSHLVVNDAGTLGIVSSDTVDGLYVLSYPSD